MTTSPRHGHADDAARRNPYVFVVGCIRSGTTMLQRMLDSHPELACTYDTHFIPPIIKDLPRGVDPPLTDEIVARVTGHRRFDRLELPAASVEAARAQATTFGAFVCGLYDEYARLRGKRLAGEKSPGYCRHLPALHAIFPWTRTIHLLRDGRDVALSIMNWGKGPTKLELFRTEPVGVCALWWQWDVRVGRRDGAMLGGDHYREVRYESLVAEPEPAMRDLASFLGLAYAPQMVAYHEGRQRSDPGLSAKAAWLPPTPGLRNWRTQMSARDVELFEALAGDELARAGYERACATISPSVRDAAQRCRAWWADHMAKRTESAETVCAGAGVEERDRP